MKEQKKFTVRFFDWENVDFLDPKSTHKVNNPLTKDFKTFKGAQEFAEFMYCGGEAGHSVLHIDDFKKYKLDP